MIATVNKKTVSVQFTNPYDPCVPSGTGKDGNIIAELGRLIDDVPSGSAIRGNIFKIRDHPASGRLIASKLLKAERDRSATVQLSLDGGTEADAPGAIGSLTHHKYCASDTGCIAKAYGGGAHAKLFTFSKTKVAGSGAYGTYNVWMGSANLTSGGDGLMGFNNAVTIYGDKSLYGDLRAYADEMYGDSSRYGDYYDFELRRGYFSHSDSAATVYVSPEQQTDIVIERLNDFAHSDNPGCKIRVMQSEIADRHAVVAELLALKNAGQPDRPCTLEVMVNNICDSQLDAFLRAGTVVKKPGVILKENGEPLLDSQGNPVYAIVHDKVILVEGLMNSIYTYRTFTGSHNINMHSLGSNDELFVSFSETGSSRPLYDAFVRHFYDAFDNPQSILLKRGEGQTSTENAKCIDTTPTCTVPTTVNEKTVYAHFSNPYNPCVPVQEVEQEPEVGQDQNIMLELDRLIMDVPAGSWIRGNIFKILQGYAGETIASMLRFRETQGRIVQISLHDNESGSTTENKVPASIRALTQHHFCTSNTGCIANKSGGGAHTKLFTFSRTRQPSASSDSLYNVWISSANLTDDQEGLRGFNNSVTIYGDVELYRDLRDYANQMYTEQNRCRDFYDADLGRGYYEHLDSAAIVHASPEEQSDLVVSALSAFDATGCRIRVMQSRIEDGRSAVVDEILRHTGCEVSVMVLHICQNQLTKFWDAGVAVKKPGKIGEVSIGVHDKVILVEGRVGGVRSYRTFAGSHNLTLNSLRANDELLVEFRETASSHPLYDAFVGHFNDAFHDPRSNFLRSGETCP